MTISSAAPAIVRIQGNGVTHTFPFAFPWTADSDVKVALVDAGTGEIIPQVLDTDYTLSDVGNEHEVGGSITFRDALNAPEAVPSTHVVCAHLKPELVQNSSYPLSAANQERALDRVYKLLGYLDWNRSRSIRLPDEHAAPHTARGLELPLASERADMVLGFDEFGDVALYTNPIDLAAAIEAAEAAAVAAASAAGIYSSAAETARNVALQAQGNAEIAEGNAELAQAYAEEWAINPEDDAVSIAAGGDGSTTFSALHWAAKSQEFAATLDPDDLVHQSYLTPQGVGGDFEVGGDLVVPTINGHTPAYADDLASTSAALGASLIGIQDAGGLITATTVEGALAEHRALINALDAAVVLKGAWDASAGTFPGGGTAQAGFAYHISVAGTVDGVAFNIGDRVLALLDNASTSVYAANWIKLDYTDQVLSVADKTGAVTLAPADTIFAATSRFFGRITASGGAGEELTGTQATSLLNAVVGDSGSGGTKGLAPAPGVGDAAANKFLHADGTYKVPAGGGGREVLLANRTYYVRADGNDSNTGLVDSAGGAFLTRQKAIDVVAALDISIYDVTIQIGAGTYTGTGIANGPWVGTGNVAIVGDATTPANVVISPTSAGCFVARNGAKFSVSGFRFTTTTLGTALEADGGGSKITIAGQVTFGACATHHIFATSGGQIAGTANYNITGGALVHYYATIGGVIAINSNTVTLTGTPAFSVFFAGSERLANVSTLLQTFSGSATGTRYSATLNSIIFTNAGGANYFPGNAAGSVATGGQYA